MEKLYLVIRKDLPLGPQIAQAVHGQDEFAATHPEVYRSWRTGSNTIVILHAKDEGHLRELHERALWKGVPCAVFQEPDMGDQATCLVLGPTAKAHKLTNRLPLAS